MTRFVVPSLSIGMGGVDGFSLDLVCVHGWAGCGWEGGDLAIPTG